MKSMIEPYSKNPSELFLSALADMYDAEHRIARTLRRLAMAANSKELTQAALTYLEHTSGHVTKIEQVFALFDEKTKGETCRATVGLLGRAAEFAADDNGSPANDTTLISAMWRVKNDEVGPYSRLHTWAVLLGNSEAADLLSIIINEEAAAEHKLRELAESCC